VADVDLIPAEYSRNRLLRRRAKQFMVACASVAVVVVAARLALERAISLDRQEIVLLQQKGKASTLSKAEADAIRQQKLRADRQLSELDELRGGDRLRLLLYAIDAAWSDSIWLDELRLVRRDRPASGNTGVLPGGGLPIILVQKPGAVPPPDALAPGAQRVEISGHAANHSRLADFMRGLGGQPGIAAVHLLDTGLGSHASRPVIDLTLQLVVDGAAKGSR